jgi:hypothetical protein
MLTYQVIELEISVHDSKPITWQVVSHVVYYFVIFVVSTAESFARFRVFDRSLLGFDTAPRIAVTSVKVGLLAVTL